MGGAGFLFAVNQLSYGMISIYIEIHSHSIVPGGLLVIS
jgi:hypothetical protein